MISLLPLSNFMLSLQTRLGAGSDGVAAVQMHPFFKGLDWKKVLLKEIPPPFVPPAAGNVPKPIWEQEINRETLHQPVSALRGVDPFSDFDFTSPVGRSVFEQVPGAGSPATATGTQSSPIDMVYLLTTHKDR